ncbi:hypothetical protein D516_2289 [Rhodobacter sp. AKP1]|nr:hypothetical protein D516_2289 [Rhodobacter sp. AKP1]
MGIDTGRGHGGKRGGQESKDQFGLRLLEWTRGNAELPLNYL